MYTGKMGAITSVVAELGEVKDKAKTFKWKEFKEYRGGVLVVSLTRLHKVMHTVHVVARVRCATPYKCACTCTCACAVHVHVHVGLGCDHGHWADPT